MTAKTLPADVCVFRRFGRFSADCRFDYRYAGVKWWIHVSSIVTHLCTNTFLLRWNNRKSCSESSRRCYFWSTVSRTHFEHSFLIDKSSCKNGEYTAFWYLQLLCYLTQLQFTISQNEWSVFQDNCRIWLTLAFSIICVCTTAFKVSIPPLKHCFRRSRAQITHKTIALLEQYFFHQKAMLYHTRNSDFSIV